MCCGSVPAGGVHCSQTAHMLRNFQSVFIRLLLYAGSQDRHINREKHQTVLYMANNTEMRYMVGRSAYKLSGYTLDNNLGLTNAAPN